MEKKSNIFILGCGRSGTSLVAGLFQNSGLFLGREFYKPRDSNPLGFFEDRESNSINEEILKPIVPQRNIVNGIVYGSDSPSDGQRWLSRINLDINTYASDEIISRIKILTLNQPFCFKDPRFSYTLNIWRDVINDNAKYICVFRDPSVVVSSIIKEVRTVPYLKDFAISVDQAFETWRLMYQHILMKHAKTGDWLFLHYNDLFQSTTLDIIEEFVGIKIDKHFPNKDLNRSHSEFELDSQTESIYSKLLSRAK